MQPRLGQLGTAILSGVFWSFAIRVAEIGIGVIASVVLARTLGARSFGQYAYIMTIASLATIVASFGAPRLLMREIAVRMTLGRFDEVRGVLAGAAKTALALGLVICLLLFAGSAAMGQYFDWRIEAFWIALVVIPLQATSTVRQAVLCGLKHAVLGQLPEKIIRPAVLVVAVGTVYVLNKQATVSVEAAVFSHVLACLAAFAIGGYWLVRHLPERTEAIVKAPAPAELLSKAFPFLALAVMAQLQAQIGALLLGMFRPIEEVGIYKIAASVGGLVVVGLTVVNVVVAPYLADLHAQRDIGRLRRLARRASLLSLIAAFPVALLLIAAGGPLLEIGFGPDYRAAYLPLAILAGGQLINGATGGVNLLLAMTGNERDSLRSVGTALGASAILSVLLIPSYGAVGAAVGSAAAMVISNGLSAFYVNRWLRQPSGGSVVV